MKFLSHIILASLFALSSMGCSGKKNKKKAPEISYIVHGDPNVLIQNTNRSASFLTPENLANFSDFHYAGAMGFVEIEPETKLENWDAVEEQNSTESTDEEVDSAFEIIKYSFTQESATRYNYVPTNGKGNRFAFDLVDGKLNLVAYNGYPVTGEHYSLKADGSAFSLLWSAKDGVNGRVLAGFYFANSTPIAPIEKGTKDYAFLIDSIKIPWREDIKIDTCGEFSEATHATISASLAEWSQDSTPSRSKRSVTHSLQKNYAPFSDLNRHCIQLISDFTLETTKNFYTAGVTLPIFNLATKTMIDSDIFIFMDHSRVANGMITGKASPTLTHELGHFFGLGHEFTRNEDGTAAHPSIMGYSQGTTAVTSWDFEAIRDLYGQPLTIVGP